MPTSAVSIPRLCRLRVDPQRLVTTRESRGRSAAEGLLGTLHANVWLDPPHHSMAHHQRASEGQTLLLSFCNRFNSRARTARSDEPHGLCMGFRPSQSRFAANAASTMGNLPFVESRPARHSDVIAVLACDARFCRVTDRSSKTAA